MVAASPTPRKPFWTSPGLDDLFHDRGDLRHGNREADARELALSDGVAAAGRDRGVHADHAPLGVGQRAAGVAGVDRRVDLDEVLVVDVVEPRRPAEAGDDAARHRESKIEGRTECERDVALPHAPALTTTGGDQVARRDLDHRDVASKIESEDLRGSHLAVMELDLDLVSRFDHVRVGHHVSGLVPDPTGTGRGELPESRAVSDGALTRHVDHRRLHHRGDVALRL